MRDRKKLESKSKRKNEGKKEINKRKTDDSVDPQAKKGTKLPITGICNLLLLLLNCIYFEYLIDSSVNDPKKQK